MLSIQVETILCRQDNYSYLIHDGQTKSCLLIDAPESSVIKKKLEELGLSLSHVLLTHEHSDHVDGLAELLETYPEAKVYGLEGGQFSAFSVKGSEKLRVPGGLVECIYTPGHSTLCTSFYFASDSILFTGDCLFNGGCGRVWGNTHEALFKSLNRIKKLPRETRIFSGHDYTEKNLRFAQTIEPSNLETSKRLSSLGQPESRTGNSLALEIETNPFLRTSENSVKRGAGLLESASELETFVALREKRNHY